MSRSSLALAVGLVCCVLLSSGIGAAAVGTVGQVAEDPLSDNTTDASAGTEATTSTVEETAKRVSDGASESTENTSETVENSSDTVSGTAENTSDTVENTSGGVTDGAVETAADVGATAVENTSDATTGSATPSRESPADSERPANRTDSAAVANENASATGARGNGSGANGSAPNASAGAGRPRGGVPAPDGESVAVGAGVGAAVAAGAAGRAYVGATGGSPEAATGVARSSVPLVRSVYRGVADRVWRFLGVAGYALHSGDPLEHETRSELAGAVEDNPGAYLSELAAASDASTSTVRYHLKVLEREGVLTPVKIRGKRRYFPGDEPVDELAAALADDATANVLRALASVGPASVSALAEELGRDPSTVTHHLDRLQEADLVERERDGRSVVNSLAPTAAAAMAPRVGEDGDATAVESSADD